MDRLSQAMASVGYNIRFRKRLRKILMIGLDGAGKTSILYKLKLGGNVNITDPTIGFNVETLEYPNVKFVVTDPAGQKKIRVLWNHYYKETQGLIFVVDSCDRSRMQEACGELHRMLLAEDKLHTSAVLILANKSDLPEAQSVSEISEELSLRFLKQYNWHVQSCSAVTGEGLLEGMEWLADQVKGKLVAIDFAQNPGH